MQKTESDSVPGGEGVACNLQIVTGDVTSAAAMAVPVSRSAVFVVGVLQRFAVRAVVLVARLLFATFSVALRMVSPSYFESTLRVCVCLDQTNRHLTAVRCEHDTRHVKWRTTSLSHLTVFFFSINGKVICLYFNQKRTMHAYAA
jgi:hypothetical protein